MTKQVCRYFFSLSLSVMLAVASAGANAKINLRATIPFDFSVRGKTLPAGTYTIATTNSAGLLVIRSENRDQGSFFYIFAGDKQTEHYAAQLGFRKYGDRYFLAQVLAYDAEYGVPESRQERNMIRELQSHSTKEVGAAVLVYIPANEQVKICAN